MLKKFEASLFSSTCIFSILFQLIGAFICFADKEVSAIDLKEFCRKHMSPQKTPTIWVSIEKFPLTGSGKIQKFKLKENFQEGLYLEIN